MSPDSELLRRYATRSDGAAFAELVRRRIDLVYSVAVRQCGGDTHLAQDVTQQVFADVARKARTLSSHAALSGWLYRAARFAASDAVRAERRRRAREWAAMNLSEEPNIIDASRLRPLLDEVLSDLNDADRDAVALRYLERRPFGQIATLLRTSEDAVRMRVNRALEKIRAELRRRGIASTAEALALALEQQAATRAPAQLTAAIVPVPPSAPAILGLKTLLVAVTSAVVVGLVMKIGTPPSRQDAAAPSPTPVTIEPTAPSPAETASVSESIPGKVMKPALPVSVSPANATLHDEHPYPPPAYAHTVVKSGLINVIGRVRSEGLMFWKRGLTASQAIEAAGGLTALADTARIKVTRIDENRKMQVFTTNTTNLATFELEPGDCVFVPERIL